MTLGNSAKLFNLAIGFAFIKIVSLSPHDGCLLPKSPNNCACALMESYDFIIVGGGTAGSVLASRLSEIQQWNILLLEAGEHETFQSRIPFFPQLLEKTRMDWNYTTTRQTRACQSVGGYCSYPRGRALGGSSAINYMVHMRGLRDDFDRWEAEGNPGWAFESIHRYFHKAEKFIPYDRQGRGRYGSGGYLPVNENEPSWLTAFFTSALGEFGLPRTDLSEGTGGGYMPMQVNILNGARVSAYDAYVRPIQDRSNLHILTSALATRILFENGTAVGVEFEKDEESFKIRATKEVILSAGTINSPQILMLSGIGPVDHLRPLGVTIVRDLPVGLSLQDHVGLMAFFHLDKVAPGRGQDAIASFKEYLTTRRGVLTSPFGGLVVALVNSSHSSLDRPDMQFHLGVGENQDVCYINGFVSRPKSRGTLTLRSSDPKDPPLIDPNYLSSKHDTTIMREVVEFIFRISMSNSMKELGTKYMAHLQPGCENAGDYTSCLVKRYGQPFFHPVATCKMGPGTDPYAVVDSQLRVHGIRRLRVADASVMPHVPSTNINAPTVMVAEKASDLIKEEHLGPGESCCWEPLGF